MESLLKFRALASPDPSPGVSYEGEESQVVPDDALSLEEILRRFVRRESVDEGLDDGGYDLDQEDLDGNVDLGKLAHADLVDKEEFAKRMQEIQDAYRGDQKRLAEEEARLKAEADKAAEEKRIRIAARKLANRKGKPSA